MKAKDGVKLLTILILMSVFVSASAQRHIHKKGHNHNPHYHYTKLPQWGFTFNTVPKKAIVLQHVGVNYHFHSGIFYR
ncbi:MAG: hypothetical protein C0597_05750, partial [Marinilabiliales bacterium]